MATHSVSYVNQWLSYRLADTFCLPVALISVSNDAYVVAVWLGRLVAILIGEKARQPYYYGLRLFQAVTDLMGGRSISCWIIPKKEVVQS